MHVYAKMHHTHNWLPSLAQLGHYGLQT